MFHHNTSKDLFVKKKAELLKSAIYENNETLSAGTVVYAELIPNGQYYLSKMDHHAVFMTDAKEGVDFDFC